MAQFIAYKSTTAGTNLTVTQESYYSLINSLFTSEGVIGTGFIVEQTTTPSSQVKVNDGYILVNSGQGYKYLAWQKNSLGYELANIDANSDPSNSRRDLIIYHIDLTQTVSGGGGGSIVVVKGTPSGSPVDPNLTAYENGVDKFAIPIARVTIPPSTINISNSMITQSGNTNNSTVEAIRPLTYTENNLIESGRFAELTGAVFSGSVTFTAGAGKLTLPNYTQTQRDAIPTPPQGLTIWNTTALQQETYNGTVWIGTGLTQTQKNVLTNQILSNIQ